MKPFSFSWSRLKNYRTCPKRHFHVDIEKSFKEEESEQLKWGNQVHSAMANRVAKKTPLPITMAHYEDWPASIDRFRQQPGVQIKVENKLAMSEEFKPVAFFDNKAWFRGVVDVEILIMKFATAITLDWKTGGKVEPDFEQLALSAQLIFALHPEVNQVAAIYVWLGHDTQTVKVYTRDAMVPVWNGVWPTIKQMIESARTTTYPPRPSGLCRRYCPVTSCPYHGKGDR